MEDDLLRRYKKAFTMNEGEFGHEARGIFVLETDEQDWQTFFPFLHASPYAIEFLVGGEQRPLPERIEDFFALIQEQESSPVSHIEDPPVIHIDKEHLAVGCYCSAERGIEFDISVKGFQDEATLREQLARFLDFIRTIGRILNKVIILAPEVSPYFHLFHFDPGTGEEHWFLEHIEAFDPGTEEEHSFLEHIEAME
jgi:hypothetical protein